MPGYLPLVPAESAASATEGELITGRALIFWEPDPSAPGHRRKRKAIDTDQITPAADCVSTSLDALDAGWKAGAFRHLMPDFHARVARGETFVIVGDRFGIGSSREMSPAGLKGIGSDAGHELVVVCGDAPGEIFVRNAANVGLHLVRCPEAVADASDGDELAYDVRRRRLINRTRGRDYDLPLLSADEQALRCDGGIIGRGARAIRDPAARRRRVAILDAEAAEYMTGSEQILWTHRVDQNAAAVRPGDAFRVYADLLPASDGTAPLAIHTFCEITGGGLAPVAAVIVNDHFVFTGRAADQRQTAISRAFARQYRISAPYYAESGDGIFHFYLPEQGLVRPGQVIAGADSHSRTYGAYGAIGLGIGSTSLGFGWATGFIPVTVPQARRLTFRGRLAAWTTGKDIVLEVLRRWGTGQAQQMSVELVDADLQLPMPYRHTIANMMAEAEAFNGLFVSDAITTAWYASRGLTTAVPSFAAGRRARFVIDEEVRLEDVTPVVAQPFSPANVAPAAEVARRRVSLDRALIGSCTNGGYEDLLLAALIIAASRRAGKRRLACPLAVYPGSRAVARRIELAEPRLAGDSVAGVLRRAGAVIRDSWCGPCFGQGPDALRRGERAITTFNRNWQNRMGVGGEGFLASPATVAASALLGYVACPEELGLVWDPQVFAV